MGKKNPENLGKPVDKDLEERVNEGVMYVGKVNTRLPWTSIKYEDIYFYDLKKKRGVIKYLAKNLEEGEKIDGIWVIGKEKSISVEEFERIYNLSRAPFTSGTMPLFYELKLGISVLTIVPLLYDVINVIRRNEKINKYGVEKCLKKI